jgi:hypothetical protein
VSRCAPVPDPTPIEAQIVALAQLVERTSRRQAVLEDLITQLADSVTQGAVRASRREQPAELRSWLLTADPAEAVEALADLIEWLDAVYTQYPDGRLPSCWLWHPPLVEELMWLRAAHSAAYAGERPSVVAVGDWHERQRPGVARRIRAAFNACDLARHAEGKDRTGLAVPAPLAGAAARVAQTWATEPAERRLPVPSERDLVEAVRYDDAAAARR